MKSLKLLLVDDSEEILDELDHILKIIPGIKIVGKATDEVGFMQLFHQHQPDVVCLDIRLQKGSGLDILQKIKKENSSTTVFMVTNYPFNSYRKRCLELGAEFFFDKSCDISLLAQIMGELANVKPNRLVQAR